MAEGLERVKSRYGNHAVALYNYVGQHGLPGGSKGAKFSIHRLLNLWGGFVPAAERGDLCWAAYVEASAALYGSWHVSLPPDEDCEAVVIWGVQPSGDGRSGPGPIVEAGEKEGHEARLRRSRPESLCTATG